jgi:hypothetical protein
LTIYLFSVTFILAKNKIVLLKLEIFQNIFLNSKRRNQKMAVIIQFPLPQKENNGENMIVLETDKGAIFINNKFIETDHSKLVYFEEKIRR